MHCCDAFSPQRRFSMRVRDGPELQLAKLFLQFGDGLILLLQPFTGRLLSDS